MKPLFERYPTLREGLPHVELGAFPTPVERMARLGGALELEHLYVKRDDLSGALYGGNKVRKLEFLLGKALEEGRKAVLTFGGAGSNHALATAIYAREVGLRSVSMLVPQPNAQSVRRNLLMSFQAGAELHYSRSMSRVAVAALYQCCRHRQRDGVFPMLIPPGGSSPVGMIGFVNAALELAHQVEAGDLPEPDRVYAASGTMGTAIGLLLGLKAAGLRSRVVAVRVTAPQFSSLRKARRFFRAANTLLHKADPSFPVMAFPESDFEFRHEFYGEQYGLYTEVGLRAVQRVQEAENIKLEGTYTGKTFAALLADAEAGRLRDKTVVFWDTYNSRDLTAEIADVDYHALPPAFHRYFEEEVQPLDR